MIETRFCACCSAPFEWNSKYPRKTFCTSKCMFKACQSRRAARERPWQRQCKCCGGKFVRKPNGGKHDFCSLACWNKMYERAPRLRKRIHCQLCKKTLTGRQRYFCSSSCAKKVAWRRGDYEKRLKQRRERYAQNKVELAARARFLFLKRKKPRRAKLIELFTGGAKCESGSP